MSDNVTLPGTGDVIAADDCTTAGKVQLFKLAYSADGAATLATVDAKGLQVQQATAADLKATVVGTVDLGATDNAVLDTIDSTLDAIALAVATEGDALGEGILLQGDDGTDRTNVLVDAAGHLQVDVISAAAITGTVTAELSATDNAVLDVIAGAVSATHMQCDVLTAPAVRALTNADVVTAELSATDNAVLDAITTSVQLIDDTVYIDDADWSDGSSKHLLVGGLYQSAPQTITDGDVGPLEVNATGSLRIIASANSGVDIGDVDVTSIVPGVAATNLGKAEDAAHTSGDVGVMALAVAKAAAAALGAEGDYEPLEVDAYGRLHVAPLLVDPAAQKHVTYNATAAKTGDIILSPTAGKRMAITSMVIGTYGTTAARVIIWAGADADTTYSAGTDQAVFIASFTPTASATPGAVYTPATPIFLTADHNLMLTSSAAISIDICVEYYEV